MPYRDPERQRTYAREWAARRRAEWITGRVCAVCGSGTDPRPWHPEVSLRGIWSRTAAYREPLLAEAVVMCRSCLARRRFLEPFTTLEWCEVEGAWVELDNHEHRAAA